MHVRRAPVLAVTLLLAAAVGAAACGGSDSGSSSSASDSSAPASKLTVTETEFKISPPNPSIGTTGTVTFTVVNKGKFPHALAIEGVRGEPKTATIQSGQTATLKVNFTKKGAFAWYCPVGNHRQKGMQGKITVAGGSGASGGQDTGEKANQSSGY